MWILHPLVTPKPHCGYTGERHHARMVRKAQYPTVLAADAAWGRHKQACGQQSRLPPWLCPAVLAQACSGHFSSLGLWVPICSMGTLSDL